MRFYYPDINEKKPSLSGDAHTHAAYSLRMRVGDFLTVFDGKGCEYSCKITAISKDRTELEILEKKTGAGETSKDYTMYLSVIKQDRFELAVQKLTELGAGAIVPVYSSFTQRGGSLNLERLNKIAISACEQCGRSKLPKISAPIEFDELLERSKESYLIFPWEREMNGNIKDAIDLSKQEISIFIGPEGGITEDEKDRLISCGAKSVTLGPRILRAETAAITALSVVCFEMGEWKL